jgi:hypothetical protein
MQEAGLISDYLESIANALSFDRSLSRRVRQEVEDHLREAAAADPIGDRLEAERRAIASFGASHAIAAQFAIVSLAKHTRRVGAAAIVVIAAVFAAMKARVAWYTATQWAMSDDVRAVSAIVGSIDRYAFWLAVLLAIGSWAYITGRHIPAVFNPRYRQQLRRSFLLCAAAGGLLVVSVISDGALTAFRLSGAEVCAGFIVPLVSMTIEIVCAGVLVFQIRAMLRRATSTAALLKT